MKRILTLLTAVLATCMTASAQDFITKKDGTEIQAKILEVNPDNVKYVLFEEPEGPVYTILKNEILKIRYASGRNEVFSGSSTYHNIYEPRLEPVAGIVPGMKYKELKPLYNHRAYEPTPYDRFSPAWSGVASFFIPGLGQMISNEVGRGFAFLGATFGCYLVTGLGRSIAAGTLSSQHDHYGDPVIEENTGGVVIGLLMAYAGAIGATAINIASIVDAVHVAKVKNMYEQDLKKTYSFDMNLYPSINYVRTPSGCQPTAGITLAMRF